LSATTTLTTMPMTVSMLVTIRLMIAIRAFRWSEPGSGPGEPGG
jgi:hypothetical protein